MPQASPWIALEAGADAEASARALADAHERYFADAPVDAGALRSVISASWRRCARAGVTPRDHDVHVLDSADDALLRRWVESPAGRHDLPGLELLLRRRPRDPSLVPLGRRAARLRARH